MALEHLDRLVIHSGGTSVGLDLLKGLTKVPQGVHLIHQAEPFASLDPLFEGRQHPFRPNLRFHPGPLGPDFSRLFSPFGHCRRFCFRLFARHVSTFLRPFAPGPLRPFLATMGALSPARPGSSAPACTRQVWASPRGGRLTAHGRPNRVRYPTDWLFTSCCPPPRLATKQLQSVTGRRAYAWRGLSPP